MVRRATLLRQPWLVCAAVKMKCYDRLGDLKSTHAQRVGCQINGYYS